MKNIAIFASGSGSNAENIIKYFQQSNVAKVAVVLSNKADAGVLSKAQFLGVPQIIFSRVELQGGAVLDKLIHLKIDLIVLAGFLWQFPTAIINAFPDQILNIHPALLPKYGGKGMYGMNIHRAVVHNQEPETGITVHFIDEEYDQGAIVFQKSLPLHSAMTSEEVAALVQQLEHQYFPTVIEQVLNQTNQ